MLLTDIGFLGTSDNLFPGPFAYLSYMKQILGIFLIALSLTAFGQKKTEITFKVDGVCGMCETRIEKAYDQKGIIKADWDLESKNLTVAYKTGKFDTKQIHSIAANVGHDTDLVKATDEVYAAIHGCCKYRDEVSCGTSKNPDHDEEEQNHETPLD